VCAADLEWDTHDEPIEMERFHAAAPVSGLRPGCLSALRQGLDMAAQRGVSEWSSVPRPAHSA
jgi:hypothetical protein